MNRLKRHFWIILILGIAVILRFYQLSTNPPHLTPDEASLGYNAFSILKTARDEYGEFLPIVFKSFGDYKPGLYIYASVIPVAVFGLTEFAVRFASAFAGVVAVYLVYEIVLLFSEQKIIPNIKSRQLAILSAALLAISPWHIHFSRGAWEVNFALTLMLVGTFFFLKALKKNNYLIVSATFFGLSLLTYQGAKMSAVLVLVILVSLFWREVFKFEKKSLFVSLVIGFVVAMPIIISFFSGQTGRLKVFSVFSYKRPQEYLDEHLELAQVEFGSSRYYLFYSESLNTARGITGRWFNHYSPRFLLFEGDWQNPRHASPDHGQLLIVNGGILLVGLYVLIRNWKSKYSKFVLLWLVLAPLPAALSRDQVHAVRAFNMVVPLVLVISSGLGHIIIKLKNYKLLGKVGYLCIFILYLGSFIRFIDSYFVHQPIHNSQYWEYGYKQVVQSVVGLRNKYESIHVRQSFAQPYIYFLFYQKTDPLEYQKEANLIESEYGDVGRVERAAGVDFLPIDWTLNRGDFDTLFVADPIRIPPKDSSDPKEFVVEEEIKYLDSKETAFRLVGVKYKHENNQ
ncbi:ArnT family glycosyltransferase [Patescibacteria group bacterium]